MDGVSLLCGHNDVASLEAATQRWARLLLRRLLIPFSRQRWVSSLMLVLVLRRQRVRLGYDVIEYTLYAHLFTY